MNITITFRHMDGSDAVRSHVQEKISKLQKFLRQAMTVQATVSVEGMTHSIEVSISSGSAHFHAKESSQDMYTSIDLVVDKLERQIRDAKEANMDKKRGTSTREFVSGGEPGSSRRTSEWPKGS